MRKFINKIKIISYLFYYQSIYNPILQDLESEFIYSQNKKNLDEMPFLKKLSYRFDMIIKQIIMQGVPKKNDFFESTFERNSLNLFEKSQAFFRGLVVTLIDNPILNDLKSEPASLNNKTLNSMSFLKKLSYRLGIPLKNVIINGIFLNLKNYNENIRILNKCYKESVLTDKVVYFFAGLTGFFIELPILRDLYNNSNKDSESAFQNLKKMSFVDKLFHRFNMIKGNITNFFPHPLHLLHNDDLSDEQFDHLIELADDFDKQLPLVIPEDANTSQNTFLKLNRINKILETTWKKDKELFNKVFNYISRLLLEENSKYSLELNASGAIDMIKFAELICKSSVDDKTSKLDLLKIYVGERHTHFGLFYNSLAYKKGKVYSLSKSDLNFIRDEILTDKEVYDLTQNSAEFSFIPLTSEEDPNNQAHLKYYQYDLTQNAAAFSFIPSPEQKKTPHPQTNDSNPSTRNEYKI